jgi:hypothetical protein
VLASFIKLHICLVAERLSGLRITVRRSVSFVQNYLHFLIAKEKRSLLTKIRISAHSHTIETGRYNGTSREDRFYQFASRKQP